MALRESEGSYRELFEGNPQPMWVCHRKTQRVLAVNQAALRLYGYGRDEFLKLSLPQLAKDCAGVDLGAAAGRVFSSGLQRKDGSSFCGELTWQPCEFEAEQAQLVFVRETGGGDAHKERSALLERQIAECSGQLEAAQRELETFSYSISHDLQAPLRHIDGFSRALIDDYGPLLDAKAQEYLSRICQAAGKMSQLIDAVQQLARVARSELTRQPVNLSVTAQVIALELKHAAQKRQVEFRIEEGVTTDADPRLARQLMEILIGNAWKFTAKTDPVLIEFGCQQKDGQTVYFVRDNGAGFDMAYAEKLFSVFHRLHRADEFEGSGVGLAIAQRIVGRHGGRIWAESAPGRGATFYFTF